MKKINRFLALLLVMALIMPGFTFADNTNNLSSSESKTLERAIGKFESSLKTELNLETELSVKTQPFNLKEITGEYFDDNDEVRIIVELKSDPAIAFATEKSLKYEEMSKSSIKQIEEKIDIEQEQVKKSIELSNVRMNYLNSFNTTFNGFSGTVKFGDIELIENLPQVNRVYISNEYERPDVKPDMDTSKDMIGALPTWDVGYKGEGTVVAIIDSGIDPNHRDMILSKGTNPKITQETLIGKNLLGIYFTEKVPYGYNYYDLNYEIRDMGPDPSMHGMHVAGIAGANGDTNNGGIKGVAPECQLLAMKVFSNDPIYSTTFSDIYMVAIEESVKLGADVLNMSLGSTASFYMPESAEDVSITNATNNGIVCSVSAGNSGTLTYGWSATNSGYPKKENPDIGLVGAPGLNKDTIQIASIENTHQKANSVTYTKNGEEFKIPMAVAGNIIPYEILPEAKEFADGGSGHPSELANVSGKIALIVRGGLTPNFVDKIQNAQNAGAIGVIVRNHQAGGEGLINMATPATQNIPAVFIGYQGGLSLMALENKVITFTDELMTIPNTNAGKMATSSSWGLTPSLELKPELTAPGSMIYSTLNNNKYGTKSGTSMAAPHVAGGAALVMEYIEEHEVYGQLSLSEQARLAKVFLMNTAVPVLDANKREYSPRRQGAGLMNLYGAVSTPVRVVNEATNEAKVELKDFESTAFTMRFEAINDSDVDATYTVNVAVLADNIHPTGLNLLTSKYITDADINCPESITVPANGEITFEVRVDIGTDKTIYRNMFVEGFVTLTDPTDENPSLSIPYSGFYGSWDEPSILDGMRFIDPKGSSYFDRAGMLCFDPNGNIYYYTTPHIFMNPGTEAGYLNGTDNIMPYLSFMRNAEYVNYNILDKEGNNLRTIFIQQYKRKNYINGGSGSPVGMVTSALWDGKVNGEFLPDGDYQYEIAAKVHYQGALVQSKRIPITIDTVGPEVSNIAYNEQTGKLTWDSTDIGIGILGFMFNINGVEIDPVVNGEKGKTSYEFDIKPFINTVIKEYKIEITSVDKLYNMRVAEFSFKISDVNPYIYLLNPILLEAFDTNEVSFEGYVANLPSLETVLIDNVEANLEFVEHVDLYHPEEPSTIIYSGPAYKFAKTLILDDGYQEVKVEAVSNIGESASIVRRFYVDTIAPELDIDVLRVNNESKTADLQIHMRDNLGYIELYQGDSQIYVYEYPLVKPEPTDKVINHIVNLEEGDNYFVFNLKDGVGHSTTGSAIVYLGGTPQDPTMTNIKPSNDIEIHSGESVTISFNAPAEGSAYYKILLPNSDRTPMLEESAGLYTAVWTAPHDLVATDLIVKLTYVDKDGVEIIETAKGKISVKGSVEDMPTNTVIIGDEAFDIDFLNKNAVAQMKLIDWYNTGNTVYIKLQSNLIVDHNGNKIELSILPDRLLHMDKSGTVRIFEKFNK